MKKISVDENLIKASKKKLIGTHYWWIWWTKKIGMILFAIIALSACAEVPIKQVEKCAKVVNVEIFQSYLFGFIPKRYVDVYKVLDNGKRVRIDPTDYYSWGSQNWFETAKEMEIGRNYCWTEYERIK